MTYKEQLTEFEKLVEEKVDSYIRNKPSHDGTLAGLLKHMNIEDLIKDIDNLEFKFTIDDTIEAKEKLDEDIRLIVENASHKAIEKTV